MIPACLSAQKAKELGLIDRVAYVDTLRKELAKKYDADPLVFVKNYGKKEVDTDFSGPMGFLKLMQAMMGGSTSSTSKDMARRSRSCMPSDRSRLAKARRTCLATRRSGSTTIIEALREANEDKQVVAIVLRVDSPGGSALASDLIWHETQILKKPLVASMGDVAASGGYYISMGANKIIAAPSTITGSIGVVGGKMAVTGCTTKSALRPKRSNAARTAGCFRRAGSSPTRSAKSSRK